MKQANFRPKCCTNSEARRNVYFFVVNAGKCAPVPGRGKKCMGKRVYRIHVLNTEKCCSLVQSAGNNVTGVKGGKYLMVSLFITIGLGFSPDWLSKYMNYGYSSNVNGSIFLLTHTRQIENM